MGLEGEECCFATLRSRLVSDSIWTIDLAYLLADFNVRCEYCSATCDVDELAYSSSDFYSQVGGGVQEMRSGEEGGGRRERVAIQEVEGKGACRC